MRTSTLGATMCDILMQPFTMMPREKKKPNVLCRRPKQLKSSWMKRHLLDRISSHWTCIYRESYLSFVVISLGSFSLSWVALSWTIFLSCVALASWSSSALLLWLWYFLLDKLLSSERLLLGFSPLRRRVSQDISCVSCAWLSSCDLGYIYI
jgi:hypothetical protein